LVKVEVPCRCLASQEFVLWPVVLSSFRILLCRAVGTKLLLWYSINLEGLVLDCQYSLQDPEDVLDVLLGKIPLVIGTLEVHDQLLTVRQSRGSERVNCIYRDFSVHVVVERTKVKGYQIEARDQEDSLLSETVSVEFLQIARIEYFLSFLEGLSDI
jgi:hypothetical protein